MAVKYLHSQKLLDAANAIDSNISTYNQVKSRISSMTNRLLASWHGEGKTEFEKDYATIYRQLSDVGETMYDLYNALVDADAIYVQTDESISKSFNTK